ncbi:hypothetical protein BRD17_06410 [Halobacteriales archaeon SW_7_68_16]|nr:MAG: hypothetical protein BRD17_06410 [Halobacteriales archaeon SW_7_68_16]
MSMSKSFSSFGGQFAGISDGSKDLSHQNGEIKPEQAERGIFSRHDAAVLIVAEQEDLFRDTVTAIVCPGCYNQVGQWDNGVPEPLIKFDQRHCDECDMELMRHEAVVMPLDRFGTHDPAELMRAVERWWYAYHWFGPSRDAQKFRNWEHQDRWNHIVSQWNLDNRPECPVCSKEMIGKDRLDTDHHDRRTDRVLLVCRKCHMYGHNVKQSPSDNGGQTAGDVQDAKAQKLGFRCGTDIKLARYVKRYLEETDDETLRKRYVEDGGKWRHLAYRMNAYTWKHSIDIEARASELKKVYEAFEDELSSDSPLLERNDGSPSWT